MFSLTFWAVCTTMKWGCWLRIFPYKWDSKRKLLLTQKSLILNVIYKYIELCLLMAVGFISLRLAQTLGKDLPFRIRAMHIAWFLSFSGTLALKLQFDFRREEIKFFTNTVLQELASQVCQSKFAKL